MPSLSERIALHQSTASSTVDIPTNPVKGHIGIANEWCRASNAIGSGCILRAEHANGHRSAAGWEWPIRPYRAPWRDNLTARDETGL